MTGHGGWPLNVFLTPEQLPFYGGTYFPPEPRHGMPAWTQVLQAIAESWTRAPRGDPRRRRAAARATVRRRAAETLRRADRRERARARRSRGCGQSFDRGNGGFGGARAEVPAGVGRSSSCCCAGRAATMAPADAARDGRAAASTTRSAAAFARYSVDADLDGAALREDALRQRAARARLPARLAGLRRAAACWRSAATRSTGRCARCAARRAASTRRSTPTPRASRAASTCGRSPSCSEVLGEERRRRDRWLGATEQGNFEDPHHPQPGLNVLRATRGLRPDEPRRASASASACLRARERRTRPALDDKRLTSWNALMIAALADAGAALEEPRYTRRGGRLRGVRAARAARRARAAAAHLQRRRRARLDAYLEDHAFLLEALIALFEATCEERWFDEATTLADTLIARFADPEHGGFFSTAADGEALIARRKDLEDSPIPSGASSAATGLLRLAQLTGERDYERHARRVLRAAARDRPAPPERVRAPAAGDALAPLSRAPDRLRGSGGLAALPHSASFRPTGSTGSGRAPTGSPARGSRPTPGA